MTKKRGKQRKQQTENTPQVSQPQSGTSSPQLVPPQPRVEAPVTQILQSEPSVPAPSAVTTETGRGQSQGSSRVQPQPLQQAGRGRGQPQPLQQAGRGRGQPVPLQHPQQSQQPASRGPWQQPQQPQQPASRGPWQQPQQSQQAGRGGGQPVPGQQPEQSQQAPQQRPQQSQQAGRGGGQPVPRQQPQQSQQAPQKEQQQQRQRAQTSSQSPVSTKELTTMVEKMKLGIPCRKNVMKAGTQGRPITVEANVVSLTFNKNFNPQAIHYDVAFDPDKPKFMLKAAFEVVHKQYFPNRYPAFDGKKNLYSSGLLPFGEGMMAEIEVHDPERDQKRPWKVTITKVAVVDLSWLPRVAAGLNNIEQTAVQVIDVILRHGPASRCVQVGRSFFPKPTTGTVDLGNGLELWVGMFQSAIIGWKPFLNIDVAHKGFPKAQNLIDFMKEFLQRRQFTADEVNYAKPSIVKQLRGLKVLYEIPDLPTSKRTHRINDLMGNSVDTIFTLDNGQKISIFDYFLKEKKYRIKHQYMPVVWVGGRNRQIYVPAELCTIVPGQVTMKKMDEIQTSNMIKAAATSTDVRKRKIMNAFASINFNNDPCVKEFGLSVGGGFEKVPARVLEPPMINYQDRDMRVNKGVWNAAKFKQPAQLEPKTWTILSINGRYTNFGQLEGLASELVANARKCGMELSEPLKPFVVMDEPRRDIRGISQFFDKNKTLKLVMVVVPDRGNAYSKIKQVAEIHVGVLTQCIRGRTVSRLSPATVCNILLKINSKLNGVNHSIMKNTLRPPCLKQPCIIIGADVTHPPPDAVDIPSIAAVAASHDANAQFMYNIKTQLQPPREEIILNLQSMVREQLLYFYKRNQGNKPQKIIFYRDGVSEGQFGQVLARELEAIRRACISLAADYKPPITFLVVQKRHHVRLFPTDPKNSDDRNGNVQAGTVVDTVITHPSHIDFYLVSHASIQGVARPTKYRCLWDDSNMSEDEIEQLTYYLCHMFSRCNRSVSYPAPTYYAHLAAYRARVHTEDLPINIHNLDEEQRKKLKLAESITGNPMFFV
ncbi:protein argonaute-2-like isoform X2 [Athalia rosae]|uniref:protein argonaute-2-like isoform X2 n=1 Tax=Athalia rosae TaxID=37344 RepID=UPI002034193A|nr:protein argonaute-2-like isoform X2 [Athalia rosae]